jgi:hypothetical protein
MAFDIDAALRYVVERKGSDLHVKVPAPPTARTHGELHPADGAEPLSPDDTSGAEARCFRVNAFHHRSHGALGRRDRTPRALNRLG